MVTVFTGCYNQAQYLPKAIESVLAQTYDDFEYLLYDDGSTDDTWEIVQKYAAFDPRVHACRLLKQPNKAYAMNASIRAAQVNESEAWVWAPADDVLHWGLLAQKVRYAKQSPDTVLYSFGQYIDGDDKPCGYFRPEPIPTPGEFRNLMRTKCRIGFTGVYIPKSVFDKVGLFPEDEDYCEDFEWILRACKLGVDFLCIPVFLYDKRKHANCVTGRSTPEILDRVQKIRNKVKWGEND